MNTEAKPSTRPSRRVDRHRVVFVATVIGNAGPEYVGVGATRDEAVRLLATNGTEWHAYGDTVTPLEAVESTYGENVDEREGFFVGRGRSSSGTFARVEPRYVVPEGGAELGVEDESGNLYAGRPGCVHLIDDAPGGGIRCVRDDCDAWFCY